MHLTETVILIESIALAACVMLIVFREIVHARQFALIDRALDDLLAEIARLESEAS